MYILLGMAGIAVAGDAFEDVIDVTARARHVHVRPGQREAGQVVVESSL